MERIKTHKKIVHNLLSEYSAYSNKDEPNVRNELLIDEKKNAFILITLGWHEHDYIHFVNFHIEIKEDGKIWIYENRTDVSIEEELIKHGITYKDIVLELVEPHEGKVLDKPSSILKKSFQKTSDVSVV